MAATQAMMRLLKFTEADLEQNRAGMLSEAQRSKLDRANAAARIRLKIYALALGSILGFCLISTGLAALASPDSSKLVGALIVLGGIGSIGFTMLMYRREANLLELRDSNINMGLVEMAEGSISVDTRPIINSSSEFYYVNVGERAFLVEKFLYKGFQKEAGKQYRLYYTSNPNLGKAEAILSAEEI